MNTTIILPNQSYSPSLEDFCRTIEMCSRQTADPRMLAAICKTQAETVRIRRDEVSLETVDLLLETMINTLHGMAAAWEQHSWTHRLKAAVRRRPPQPSTTLA